MNLIMYVVGQSDLYILKCTTSDFFKCSSNNNSTNTTSSGNDEDNWAEIQQEARRIEQELFMESLRQELECPSIKKGELDVLEKENEQKED